MQVKIFTRQMNNDADVASFERMMNAFIEAEINSKNKVIYDICQTEVPLTFNNGRLITVLTITISYEDAEK